MLLEFRKYKNATDATNAINFVYPDALDDRTYQGWFKKFKKSDFDLLDGIKSGKLRNLIIIYCWQKLKLTRNTPYRTQSQCLELHDPQYKGV